MMKTPGFFSLVVLATFLKYMTLITPLIEEKES